MDDLKVYIPLTFVAAVMAICFVPRLVLATLRRRSRLRDLSVLANRLGFRIRPGPDDRAEQELPGFEQNIIRPAMDAVNTIEGDVAVGGRRYEVRLGDCLSQMGRNLSGDDALNDAMTDPSEMRSYVALRLPTIVIPDVVIVPQAAGSRLVEAHGLEPVRFELEAFNREFIVASSRPRFAYDILTPGVIDVLMQGPPSRLAIGRGWCVSLSLTGPWETDRLEATLRFLMDFFALWPEHVLADLDALSPRRGTHAHG